LDLHRVLGRPEALIRKSGRVQKDGEDALPCEDVLRCDSSPPNQLATNSTAQATSAASARSLTRRLERGPLALQQRLGFRENGQFERSSAAVAIEPPAPRPPIRSHRSVQQLAAPRAPDQNSRRDDHLADDAGFFGRERNARSPVIGAGCHRNYHHPLVVKSGEAASK
jgi:hypothetical protein